MAKFYDTLPPKLAEFIGKQKMYFVATAAQDGRVNLSPKGLDSLRVLNESRILWLNLTGSGNETAAHIQQVNRITLMFCSFEGPALILRVYGTARAVHPRDAEWESAYANFPDIVGARQIFDVQIESVQTSCGFAVPLYEFVDDRSKLIEYSENLGDDGLVDYWERKNTTSIDGLPTGIFD